MPPEMFHRPNRRVSQGLPDGRILQLASSLIRELVDHSLFIPYSSTGQTLTKAEGVATQLLETDLKVNSNHNRWSNNSHGWCGQPTGIGNSKLHFCNCLPVISRDGVTKGQESRGILEQPPERIVQSHPCSSTGRYCFWQRPLWLMPDMSCT